jgi:hypothetical protein
MPRY